jgi:hypothetical protein
MSWNWRGYCLQYLVQLIFLLLATLPGSNLTTTCILGVADKLLKTSGPIFSGRPTMDLHLIDAIKEAIASPGFSWSTPNLTPETPELRDAITFRSMATRDIDRQRGTRSFKAAMVTVLGRRYRTGTVAE